MKTPPNPFCWKCGKPLDLPDGPVPMRATCDHCGSWLHCCLNCQNYRKGSPNDCLIPDIDLVADKEKMNYCDYFKILGRKHPGGDPEAAAKKLFGDSGEQDKTDDDPFSKLFK